MRYGKARYKFLYRADDGSRYYWQSIHPVSPGESRHEVVSCDAAWFWGQRADGTARYRRVRPS